MVQVTRLPCWLPPLSPYDAFNPHALIGTVVQEVRLLKAREVLAMSIRVIFHVASVPQI